MNVQRAILLPHSTSSPLPLTRDPRHKILLERAVRQRHRDCVACLYGKPATTAAAYQAVHLQQRPVDLDGRRSRALPAHKYRASIAPLVGLKYAPANLEHAAVWQRHRATRAVVAGCVQVRRIAAELGGLDVDFAAARHRHYAGGEARHPLEFAVLHKQAARQRGDERLRVLLRVQVHRDPAHGQERPLARADPAAQHSRQARDDVVVAGRSPRAAAVDDGVVAAERHALHDEALGGPRRGGGRGQRAAAAPGAAAVRLGGAAAVLAGRVGEHRDDLARRRGVAGPAPVQAHRCRVPHVRGDALAGVLAAALVGGGAGVEVAGQRVAAAARLAAVLERAPDGRRAARRLGGEGQRRRGRQRRRERAHAPPPR
jgi:hypothetical protein